VIQPEAQGAAALAADRGLRPNSELLPWSDPTFICRAPRTRRWASCRFLVQAAEMRPEFAAQLPDFLKGIRRIVTAQQICTYLDDLERTRFLFPSEPEEDSADDADDELEPEDLAGCVGDICDMMVRSKWP